MSNDFPNYGLGRRYSPDERDKFFPLRALTYGVQESVLPNYRYYRTGAVLNQKSDPACVGFSWRSFLDAAPMMTHGGLAPYALYKAAQEYDEWEGQDYEGSSVCGGAKYLQHEGLLASYLWASSIDDMRRFILSGQGTIVIGVDWYEQMFETDAKGFIVPKGQLVGGHATHIVGADDEGRRFRIKNSWGVSFGQRGRCWLRYSDMGLLLEAQGEAATAIEQQRP